MYRLKNSTAHEPFPMKQLEEGHHQNEATRQGRRRHRIWGNERIPAGLPEVHAQASTYDPTPAGENACVCVFVHMLGGVGVGRNGGEEVRYPKKATFKCPLRWKMI